MTARRDLDLDEDFPFQRRQWVIERVGWGLLAVTLLAGAAGAFGDGPLSRAQAGDGNPGLRYERFARHGKPVELEITVSRAQSEEARVSITREYLSAMQVERVTPEPERVEASGDELSYVFAASKSASPITIIFTLRPDELGFHEASVRAGQGVPVTLKQFTYP